MKHLFSFFLTLFFAAGLFGQKADPAVQAPVRPMKLRTIDGKTIDTESLRGKIVVYNLWFVGCPPCMEEIPTLNEIVDEFAGRDVVFIGLSSSSKREIEIFTKTYPFRYQVVPDSERIMLKRFGQPDSQGNPQIKFPLHVVVDRDGFVAVRAKGMSGVEAVRRELRRQFAEK